MKAGGYKLHRFEGDIPGIETKHQLDLKFSRQKAAGFTEYKLVEMKNWKVARSISGDTYKQFREYVTSGHPFEYYFSDGLQSSMKTSFQNLFKNTTRVDELWDANAVFFKSKGYRNKNGLIQAATNGELIDSALLDFVK